jgi:hypothetical protein
MEKFPVVKVKDMYIFPSKLDGVGPLDNRPSTDKLHRFVRKKKKKKSDM